MGMITIWKYQFNTVDEFFIEMPKNGRILAVQTQFDQPCMWVLVDPGKPKEKRYFRVFGTGHDIDGDANLSYLGTYQLHEGSLIFHIFEDLK